MGPILTHSFFLYQKVRILNVKVGKEKWISGTIVQIKGPNTYLVKVPGNKHRFVHVDHLRNDDCEDTINIKVGEMSDPVQSPVQMRMYPVVFHIYLLYLVYQVR